jgi:hypothetical protein
VRLFVAALLASAVAAGCGAEDESPRRQEDSKATVEAHPKPGCSRASKALLRAIATGLEVQGGGSLRRGFIVRSEDFKTVFMVAADIQGSGLEGPDDVGVWATNSPTAQGSIFAVDGVSQEFSEWGDANKTDAAIDLSADGVDEARSCAEG